ncbi:MAG: hypothetical protein BWY15_00252 [Firmicutes bacterium ADurb.Bin193]|nr:MAG: hypothetical protein BWY15_00252 [Firmicutes bacterium ADurb.Bin193]
MNSHIGCRKGFTLVEVLIAIAVLGVFVVPITGMFISSVKGGETSGTAIEGYAIANRIIEAMSDEEIAVPRVNEPILESEYVLYNISKAFEVKRTVEIIEGDVMESFGDLQKLEADGLLFTIDAGTDGVLVFTNALVDQLNYPVSIPPDKTEIVIEFKPEGIITGSTTLADVDFRHIRVIGGQGNVKLILQNKAANDKTVYITDVEQGGPVSVEMSAESPGVWTIYNNMVGGEDNRTGSVATSDITISVRHIATNKEYKVNSKRVFYRYR